MRDHPTRRAASGSQVIQILGILLLTLMASALAVDFGYYYTVRNNLQTAADSASLAAVTALYKGTTADVTERKDSARTAAESLVETNQPDLTLEDNDLYFGYVDPASKVYDPDTFRTPTADPKYALTGGYNAIRVRVRKSSDSVNGALNTLMANMFGMKDMNVQATSVALMDQTVDTITDGGLRPIYVCQAQFDKAMQDGNPSNDVVRIYGDHTEVNGQSTTPGCPALSSGNWAFADFTDCSSGTVGASTIADWFANGYPGTVKAGQCYSTKPGNFIPSIRTELDNLISNQTLFGLPLYDSWGGNGSNTHVNVSGFAGFRITDYKATGSQGSRYIEGRFYPYSCNKGCSSSGSGISTAGGTAVKLRLASQS